MSSALAVSSAAIVPGSLGRPAARSRCIRQRRRARGVRRRGRRADHRDAGPDGGRRRRDGIGLGAAVLGRSLRRVVGRGVALPVARADGERAAARRPASGCSTRVVASSPQLDAAAEDLEVAGDARRALLDAQGVGAGRRRQVAHGAGRARGVALALGVHDGRALRRVGHVDPVPGARGRERGAVARAAAPVERRAHADVRAERECEVAAAERPDVRPAVPAGVADDALPVAARVVAGRVDPEDARGVRAVDGLRGDAGAVERPVEERVRVDDDIDARLPAGPVDEPVDGLRELELRVVVDERVARARRDVPHDLRDVRAVAGRLVGARDARDLGLAARAVERLDRVDLRERRQLLAEQAAPALAEAEVDDGDADAGAVEAARAQRVGADPLDALRDDLVGLRSGRRADAGDSGDAPQPRVQARAPPAPAAASRRARSRARRAARAHGSRPRRGRARRRL